ncbi:MAG: hypothetical protein HFI45_15785 [Lachnospiraceae bacterium]|nr:hypothetical protein [Lachnospiraceae bacterium]
MELLVKMNLKNAVERVLHVPGNYTGGVLEMTLVVDCGLPDQYVRDFAGEIAGILRMHSEVFRNVRMNLLLWKSDREMENKVIPLSFLQTSGCFEDYRQRRENKKLEQLAAQLKSFHARSKLILVLIDQEFFIEDEQALIQNMKPFLGKKSLFFLKDDPEGKWRRGMEFPLQGDLPG